MSLALAAENITITTAAAMIQKRPAGPRASERHAMKGAISVHGIIPAASTGT